MSDEHCPVLILDHDPIVYIYLFRLLIVPADVLVPNKMPCNNSTTAKISRAAPSQ